MKRNYLFSNDSKSNIQHLPLYLNIEEAAHLLGISESTLYKKTSNRLIPFYKPTGRKILFKKEDLLQFIEQGKILTQGEVSSIALTNLIK